MSHSTRVRGLKYLYGMAQDELCRSHSTRVRGLKFHIRRCSYGTYHVALYTSAWIEIFHFLLFQTVTLVALYTSAWIEIELQYCYHNC